MELWPFSPQEKYVETLEWLTDIIRAPEAEQRIALREDPRNTYSYKYFWDYQTLSHAKLFIRDQQEKPILLPIWGEMERYQFLPNGLQTFLIDTTIRRLRIGQKAVVWESHLKYTVGTIVGLIAGDITIDTPLPEDYTNALVMPLQEAYFEADLRVPRRKADYVTATVSFICTDDVLVDDDTARQSLNNEPLFIDAPELIGQSTEVYRQEFEEIDNSVGVLWRDKTMQVPTDKSFMAMTFLNAQEQYNVRKMIHGRKGKQSGFWYPTFANDLELVQDITVGDTTIVVNNVEFQKHHSYQFLFLLSIFSGNAVMEVVDSVKSGSTETLALKNPVNATIPKSIVESISYMRFMRFDSDRIEFSFDHLNQGRVVVPVVEAPELDY
jgi:hypothetical protein